MEAYCFKCRTKREISNPQQVSLKNGRPATQGVCPVCGTKVFRIGKGLGTAAGEAGSAGDSDPVRGPSHPRRYLLPRKTLRSLVGVNCSLTPVSDRT